MNADERLAVMLEVSERRLKRRFGEVIGWLRSRYTDAQIETMVRTGNVEPLVRDVSAAVARLAAEVTAVYIGGGESAAAWARTQGTKASQNIVLDVSNPRAVRWAQTNQYGLVQQVTSQTRDVIRDLVTRGLEYGVNPRQVARELKLSLGLTKDQTSHVDSFRRALQAGDANALTRQLRDRRFDPSIRGAMAGTRAPLTPAEVDRMVDRYREGWVAYRAEVIARTEALKALNEGDRELWLQGVDSGTFEERQIDRKWITAGDHRRRPSHRSMHGQHRGLNERFMTGDGYTILYPHDPSAPGSETIQCRCTIATRIITLREADERDRRNQAKASTVGLFGA